MCADDFSFSLVRCEVETTRLPGKKTIKYESLYGKLSFAMNIVLTSAKSFRSTARARRSQPVERSFLGINKKSFYILYLMFMRSEIIFSYKLDESFGGERYCGAIGKFTYIREIGKSFLRLRTVVRLGRSESSERVAMRINNSGLS